MKFFLFSSSISVQISNTDSHFHTQIPELAKSPFTSFHSGHYSIMQLVHFDLQGFSGDLLNKSVAK